MLVIVVDIGSSFIKSALVDPANGSLFDHRRQPTPSRLGGRPPGRYELDPTDLSERVRSQLDAHRSVRPEAGAVFMSTQMHCFVLTDRNGRPASPIITWQDRRFAEASTGHQRETVRELFGPCRAGNGRVPLRPGLPLATLAHWLSEHDHVDGLEFHTLGSFVNRALGGDHATQLSSAAATGMINLADRSWDDEAITAIGADRLSFPTITDRPVGHWRPGGAMVELWPDLGDHQAAILGSGARAGDIVLSLGTAGLAARLAPTPVPTIHSELRPHINGYLHTVSGLPGGRHLQHQVDYLSSTGSAVFGRTLSVADVWTRLEAALPDGVVAAFDDPYQRALGLLTTDAPASQRLFVTGGVASRLPTLARRLAAIADLPTEPVQPGEPALIGLAKLARAATARPEAVAR